MAGKKTDPEPFPVRGTPNGYRDSWDADDQALIQAQIAERERQLVAVRESTTHPRRGRGPKKTPLGDTPGHNSTAPPDAEGTVR